MGDIRAHDVALGHLNARGFIQFHPLLAQRLDSFKAAIFLGHALYWSRYLAHAQPHRRGWFFMSAAQWREATGLSTHEQASARGELTRRGLLEEALAGRPAILHYRVNLHATASFLDLDQLNWETMSELFHSCIRFYKPLSDICGGVSAGLYLSYLLQRQSFALRNPQVDTAAVELFPGEFCYRPEHARIALCLGIKAQRNAREKLKAAGFIREGRSSQEVVATRVNLAAIASCLQAQEQPVRKRSARKVAAAVPLALVPARKPVKPLKEDVAKLSRTTLPQRQQSLFAPMSLAHPMSPSGRDTTTERVPVVEHSSAAAIAGAAQLVRSLFAPSLFGRHRDANEAAPIFSTSLPVPKLSTTSALAGPEFALSENSIRPFLDVNLPFFRNYKEQGISRYSQTTTTPPADDAASEFPGRRRVARPGVQKWDTAVSPKIGGSSTGQIAEGASSDHRGGMGQGGSRKTPADPESGLAPQQVHAAPKPVDLHLPDRLEPSLRAGVLATVAQAKPELQQDLLDELAGHLAMPNKTIHNPIGWLHTLIRRQADGFVALALAPQVAEQRRSHQRHLERLAKPVTSASHEPAAATAAGQPTSDSEIRRTHRQKLLELRATFEAKRGGLA